MKHNDSTQSLTSLQARFRAYRSRVRNAARAGAAVLSLSAIKTANASDAADTARRIGAVSKVRDSMASEDADLTNVQALARMPIEDTANVSAYSLTGYLLTPSERAALQAARPGSRSLILKASTQTPSEDSEPLPEGFIPKEVAPYVSLVNPADTVADEATEAEAEAEIALEDELTAQTRANLAARSFESDYQPEQATPESYDEHLPVPVLPIAAKPSAFRPIVRALRVEPAPFVSSAQNLSSESLRASVLANAKRR